MPDVELALVLHSHMPYVEGFGTWPFGEEWLWEAIATSYLPLLDVLDEGGPVTLGVTPVLADQLEAPGALDRCRTFLTEVRARTHREDLAKAKDAGVAAALEHSARQYEWAAGHLGDDLLGRLLGHAGWTSAATHPVLPLLATDAGVRLQLETGIASHRRRAGEWEGGLWLPECGHATWLDPLLEEAGVQLACVDLTPVFGLGAAEHRRLLRSRAGPVLIPIDREVVELVWSPGGYPADAAYRDYHALTEHHHRGWANDGTPYDPELAERRAREHDRDFVASVAEREGLVTCALDTELLGHWWHEGVAWLRAVIDGAEGAGVALVRLDTDLVERRPPVAAPAHLPATTWGTGRDLSTWSGPKVADLAWSMREAELRAVHAARDLDAGAVRELLALQASDWAFLVTEKMAGDYPRERAAGHRARFDARLAGEDGDDAALRHLAPDASAAPLLAA